MSRGHRAEPAAGVLHWCSVLPTCRSGYPVVCHGRPGKSGRGKRSATTHKHERSDPFVTLWSSRLRRCVCRRPPHDGARCQVPSGHNFVRYGSGAGDRQAGTARFRSLSTTMPIARGCGTMSRIIKEDLCGVVFECHGTAGHIGTHHGFGLSARADAKRITLAALAAAKTYAFARRVMGFS